MISGYKQWLRKYQVLAGSLDVSALRCTFNIEKSVNETPNYAHIVLYNLAAPTIAQIKAGDEVVLSAGYEQGNYGMIFRGEVVQPYVTRKDGVDILLHLICQDGDAFLNTAVTAKTLEKGSTVKDVVDTCSSIPQNKISDKIKNGDSYIRGKVLFGQSSSYLKDAAISTETQFYVDNGEINIVGAKDYEDAPTFELNADTGLIGDPSQTDDGVSAKCLINPAFKLNTLVHIDSSSIAAKALQNAESTPSSFSANGVYRIVKLVFQGDTDSDEWYCTFDAITQDGSNPAGTTTADTATATATTVTQQDKPITPVSSDTGKDAPAASGGPRQSVLKQLIQSNPWR